MLAVFAVALPRSSHAQERAMCVVERITDGDTIRCGGERIRLLLIDAPEMDQGPFGRAAQAFLEAILPVGAKAETARDVEERDRYGRLLAYVYRHDGRMVNAMMARQGFAVPLSIPPNVRHIERVRAAADSARADRIGLWAVEAFECRPDDFREGRCGAPASGVASGAGDGQPRAARARPGCDPAYPEVCIPPPPPDLDCRHVEHQRFRTLPPDPHRFDGNHDGVGCEGPP